VTQRKAKKNKGGLEGNGGALPHAPKASDNYVFDRNTGINRINLSIGFCCDNVATTSHHGAKSAKKNKGKERWGVAPHPKK